MMSVKRPAPTIVLASWIAECGQALDDADYLVGRLGKWKGNANSDLPALQVRISALRAQLELLGEADDIQIR